MSSSEAPERPSAGDPPVPSAGSPYLTDIQVVVLTVGTWAGAAAALPVPLPVGIALMALGLARRWPWLIVASLALVACARGAASEADYQPVASGRFSGPVVVVTDPAPFGPGWRCDVRLPDGQRVEASGYGSVGFDLSVLTAGDTVEVEGRLRPMSDTPWARARHLVGRLGLERIGSPVGPSGPRAVVESVRTLVARGADPLPERLRPLYLGLVIGDDRLQPAAQQARFRAAGLSHLLAVSGQNVAFLLTVARPVIHLAGRRARFGLTVVVLVGFALATRAEPSVLRATTTAGLAAWAAVGGHSQGGLRLLALAVAGLLLVDPFLVHSVGFQLSVAASAGILTLSPRLAASLPGPPALTEPLAVTVGAQVAVLPLLLAYFGPVSTASVPANLLAGWAAGAVMTWGLTVGVVAGVLPDPMSGWLQLPAAAMVAWLDGVAAWAGRLPAPVLGPSFSLVAAAALVLVWFIRRWRPMGLRRLRSGPVPAVVAALVMAAALASVPRTPGGPTVLDGGGLWLPGGTGRPSVLVLGPEADDRVLDALLGHRITAVDIVVSARGTRAAGALVRSVSELTTVGTILGPPRHRIKGATTVTARSSITSGGAVVDLAPGRDRLEVMVGPGPGPALGSQSW